MIGSSSGSGKTSFGKRLAGQLDLRFIELDALHWGPAWRPLEADAFRARVEPELGAEGWVVDGNYGKLGELIYERADTGVWLDVPLRVALWRRSNADADLWLASLATRRGPDQTGPLLETSVGRS